MDGMFRENLVRSCLLLTAVLAAAYSQSPLRLGVVCGDSMSPAFESGELFLIDRNYYRSHPVLRGDVVVARCNGATHMKRVAAVEGAALYLMMYDSVPIDEVVMRWQLPAVERMLREHRSWMGGGRLVRREIPPGRVYLLGDKLAASEDSRKFGLVDVADIQGKVIAVGEPRSHTVRLAGSFRPRVRL